MKIRQGKLTDLDRLVAYGEEFWNHTYYKQDAEVPYDGASVRQLCVNLMTLEGAGFIQVVVDDEDEVKGFALVAYFPCIFSFDIKMSGELAFYLDDSCRGKGMAPKLLKSMESQAGADSCRFISMISMKHSMDVGPLYEKLGYTEGETTYIKEIG